MLTDIFARRYQDVPIWNDFDEAARRLLVQGFRIVSEQLFPYSEDKKVKHQELWDELNKQLAMELGLEDLSSPESYYSKVPVCKNFVCAAHDGSVSADRFVKERLSFIEIAFRKKGEQIVLLNSELEQKIARVKQRGRPVDSRISNEKWRQVSDGYEQHTRNSNTKENQAFRASCEELNTRFRQAGAKLNYHNGFIQISSDNTVADQIERPFWNLVSAPKWKNVDQDMKEAIDLRDSSGRDPAWHAAKALESTIKIISDEKNWTRGKENGPINYVENLGAKKNGHFIADWEREGLINFFSNVRAPLGHGPGSGPMPELSPQRTDWAIEFCMIWIKSLIRRM